MAKSVFNPATLCRASESRERQHPEVLRCAVQLSGMESNHGFAGLFAQSATLTPRNAPLAPPQKAFWQAKAYLPAVTPTALHDIYFPMKAPLAPAEMIQ
jgi:hypothetical protein